jgi:hypothetical protein
VWSCPDGIATIISMSNAPEELCFDVSYSLADDTATNCCVFAQSDIGLFFSDAAAPAETEISLVTTVEDKHSKYSKTDYSR